MAQSPRTDRKAKPTERIPRRFAKVRQVVKLFVIVVIAVPKSSLVSRFVDSRRATPSGVNYCLPLRLPCLPIPQSRRSRGPSTADAKHSSEAAGLGAFQLGTTEALRADKWLR